MSNGLDDVERRRRERGRGRQTPPPKHPRSEQEQTEQPAAEASSAQPSEPAADSTQEAPPSPEPHPQAPVTAERAAPRRSDAARSERRPSIEAYLDEDLMDQLWAVEAAGVTRRERHLQSPVVRLALRELFGRYTPEQVVDQVLAASPPKTGKQGRPRR